MNDRTIISWTPENWLTVLLMVAVGGFLIGCAMRVAHKFTGGSDAA